MTHQPYLHEALNLEAMLRHEREHGIVYYIRAPEPMPEVVIEKEGKNRGPVKKTGKGKQQRY